MASISITKFVGLACAVLVGTSLFGGCGESDARQEASRNLAQAQKVSGSYRLPGDPKASHVIAITQARHEYSSTIAFERTLAEALPNQAITVNGQPIPGTRGVVIGHVVDVEPGVSYTVAGDDAAAGTEAAFDHQDAVWRIAVVTLKASHYLSGKPGAPSDEPSTIRFGAFIAAEEDARTQMEGLKNLGDVIVVLDPERTYQFERELPWIARSGSLLGDIDSGGRIGFPALGAGSKAFVGGVDER